MVNELPYIYLLCTVRYEKENVYLRDSGKDYTSYKGYYKPTKLVITGEGFWPDHLPLCHRTGSNYMRVQDEVNVHGEGYSLT